MTQPEQSNSNGRRRPVNCQLRPATIERLDELAAAAGVKRATMVAELLEELVPKVETVTRRVAIKLKEGSRS